MNNMKRRIEKIEKELDIEDKTKWLRIPDPDNPDGFIKIKGCRTLVDFLNCMPAQETEA
jgi:hypothetical protein